MQRQDSLGRMQKEMNVHEGMMESVVLMNVLHTVWLQLKRFKRRYPLEACSASHVDDTSFVVHNLPVQLSYATKNSCTTPER